MQDQSKSASHRLLIDALDFDFERQPPAKVRHVVLPEGERRPPLGEVVGHLAREDAAVKAGGARECVFDCYTRWRTQVRGR
jgi:hypothetical protein